MRNWIFIGLLLAGFTAPLAAQFWQTDFEEAKGLADSMDRPVILVFQGSDWCAPCIKLDKEIWSNPEFIEYAGEHYIMLKADFPRRKSNALPAAQQEHNNHLAELYNQNGYFPLVVVLNAQGKVLGKTGYEKISPHEYIELLNSFTSIQ